MGSCDWMESNLTEPQSNQDATELSVKGCPLGVTGVWLSWVQKAIFTKVCVWLGENEWQCSAAGAAAGSKIIKCHYFINR